MRPQCPPPSAAAYWHDAIYKIISGEFTFKSCKLLSGPKVVLREGWIEEYKEWTICWDTLGKLNAIADQVRLQAVHSDDYHSDNYEWIAVTEVWEGLPRGAYFPKDHFFVLLFFFSFLFSFIAKENTWFFFYSLKADPPKGTYFFDRFEVMSWLTDKIWENLNNSHLYLYVKSRVLN